MAKAITSKSEVLERRILRTLLLIDAGYYVAIQKETGHIDLLKFKSYVGSVYGGAGKITRGYYVTTFSDSDAARGFHHFVKHDAKLTIVEKSTKTKTCSGCGKELIVEKGVDVSLAVFMLQAAYKDQYDRLILVNGDGDLLDALTLVRDTFNKEILIVGTSRTISGDLKALATEIVHVDDPEVFKNFSK